MPLDPVPNVRFIYTLVYRYLSKVTYPNSPNQYPLTAWLITLHNPLLCLFITPYIYLGTYSISAWTYSLPNILGQSLHAVIMGMLRP
ncbi:hypothetical protein K445DRAFT_112877 [Daldinia sp. EC12]|nr:hypothetical protein K445DRAFT_112877 [Daldinia sp. EC12]